MKKHPWRWVIGVVLAVGMPCGSARAQFTSVAAPTPVRANTPVPVASPAATPIHWNGQRPHKSRTHWNANQGQAKPNPVPVATPVVWPTPSSGKIVTQ